MNARTSTLLEDFQRYFRMELALTPELKSLVYRIRYRVYCEEFGYEPLDDFPEEEETDEFDDHSIHCIVVHTASNMPAGCVRLVTADSKTQMPMERYCYDSLDTNLYAKLAENRLMVCEFSRLAVDGAFRRRSGEAATRFGEISCMDLSAREKRTFSLIAVATFLGGFAVSELIERNHAFAMMEPFLPRMLKRSGIEVQRVGEDVDYHGIRAPYFITTEDAVSGMPTELRDFYMAIRSDFSSKLAPANDHKIAIKPVSERKSIWPLFGGWPAYSC